MSTTTKSTRLLDDDVVEVTGEFGVLAGVLKQAARDYIALTDTGWIVDRQVSTTKKWPAKLRNTYTGAQDAHNLLTFLFDGTGAVLLSTFTSNNFNTVMRLLFKNTAARTCI